MPKPKSRDEFRNMAIKYDTLRQEAKNIAAIMSKLSDTIKKHLQETGVRNPKGFSAQRIYDDVEYTASNTEVVSVSLAENSFDILLGLLQADVITLATFNEITKTIIDTDALVAHSDKIPLRALKRMIVEKKSNRLSLTIKKIEADES